MCMLMLSRANHSAGVGGQSGFGSFVCVIVSIMFVPVIEHCADLQLRQGHAFAPLSAWVDCSRLLVTRFVFDG